MLRNSILAEELFFFFFSQGESLWIKQQWRCENKIVTTVKSIAIMESIAQRKVTKCYASQRLPKIWLLCCKVYMPIKETCLKRSPSSLNMYILYLFFFFHFFLAKYQHLLINTAETKTLLRILRFGRRYCSIFKFLWGSL